MKSLSLFMCFSFSLLFNAAGLERIFPLSYRDYQKAQFKVDHEPSKNGMGGLWAQGESCRKLNEPFNRFRHPVNGSFNSVSGTLIVSKRRFFFKTGKQYYHIDDSYPRKILGQYLQTSGIDLTKATSFKLKIRGYWTFSRYSGKYQIAYLEDIFRL